MNTGFYEQFMGAETDIVYSAAMTSWKSETVDGNMMRQEGLTRSEYEKGEFVTSRQG